MSSKLCCKKSDNRNRRFSTENECDIDDENRKQINTIVCRKSMIFVFNILFMLSGIGLVGFGIYTIKTNYDYLRLLTSSLYEASTYILLTSGSIIIITAILGIIGACISSKRVLIAYVILLSVIIISEILAGALAFTYRAKLKDSLRDDLNILIKEQYNQQDYEKKTQSLDNLQIKFKCCGANNYNDWINSTYILKQESNELKKNLVAESCCKTPSKYCAVSDHPSNINYNGCVDALENSIKIYILLLGILGCGVCFIQSIGILLAILLIKEFKNSQFYSRVKSTI